MKKKKMMMMMIKGLLPIVVALLPAAANAQTRSASDVLSFLTLNQAVATADFVRDVEAAEATRETLAASLLVELTTFPLPTASSGFSYQFNPAIGTMERVAQGFGPFFVDRAATAGAGHVAMSVTYRSSAFVSLDGRALRDGSLVTVSNKFRDETSAFEFEALTLNVRTDTVTAFANYGLTDRIDVGVAVPVVRIGITGERASTYRGQSTVQARGSAESIGFGDVPIRSKQHLLRARDWGLATSVELYLPTGDPENLRGSGRTVLKGSVIASSMRGPLEWSANAGYVFGGISNYMVSSGAMAVAVSDRLTVTAEAVAQRVGRTIGQVAQPHPSMDGVDTIRLLPNVTDALNVTAITGFRWNVSDTWLVNSYVLIPVTGAGLAARLIPAVSLDYLFVRR